MQSWGECRRSLVWVTAGIVAVCGVDLAWAQEAGDVVPKVGDKAPPIELEGLLQAPEGASTTAEALRGKVVVLEFWATWCGPCIVVLPHLNKLADRFKDKPVRFISITDESREVVERFLNKRSLKSWVGLDTDRSVFRALRVAGIPRTVIIDTKGKIAALIRPGQITEQVLHDLLAGKAVTLTDPYAAAGKAADTEDPKGEPLLRITIHPADSPDQFGGWSMNPGRYRGKGVTLQSLIATAHGVSKERVVGSAPLDRRYDVVVSLPPGRCELLKPLLQSALEAAFGFSTRRQMREADVYALRKIAGTEPKIRKGTGGGAHASQSGGTIVAVNWDIQGLVGTLQNMLGEPVVNETALEGIYDWDIQFDEHDPQTIIKAVRQQLGLELVKAKRPVEFLVVEESIADPAHPSAPGR